MKRLLFATIIGTLLSPAFVGCQSIMDRDRWLGHDDSCEDCDTSEFSPGGEVYMSDPMIVPGPDAYIPAG